MSLKRSLYSFVLYLLFPLVLLRLLWRSRANPDYRKRWSERLGFISTSKQKIHTQNVIWLHAVSVGEAIAAKPLIVGLLDNYPNFQLLVTTTTPTGSDRVKAIFADEIQQQKIIHVYFPYDLLGAVSRFIKAFKPKILIVVETEIWPNLYARCHQQDIPVLMVNARLSEKSTKSYYKIKGLVAETLARVSTIAVRSKIDAERFQKLGAKLNQIKEVGNVKYDISIDESQVSAAKQLLKKWNTNHIKKRPVFVAASTHKGEDEKIVFIYLNLLQQFPDLILVLVPRHPERFDEVYESCREHLPTSVMLHRHSQNSSSKDRTVNVILGDSMGEMQMWYATADVVFIGGSLVKTGGHNPLEATIFGVPVVSGQHMFNFEDIASELSSTKLLYICDDEFGLTNKINSILSSAEKANSEHADYHKKAELFMQQHRGVTARLLALVSGLID
ncbi:UNVERIFIED_CONTAM: hypothetical protein GTU68_002251 [Idotea baltica]|nr:hypothetical protein [Idotea baltica]